MESADKLLYWPGPAAGRTRELNVMDILSIDIAQGLCSPDCDLPVYEHDLDKGPIPGTNTTATQRQAPACPHNCQHSASHSRPPRHHECQPFSAHGTQMNRHKYFQARSITCSPGLRLLCISCCCFSIDDAFHL